MARTARTMLLVAGVLSGAMAAYHFVLPFQWGWPGAVGGVPPMIRWALFAINTFFSTLLLLLSALVVLVASTRRHTTLPGVWVIAAAAAFWAVNLAYQIACPMPIPESMPLLRAGLPAFALAVLLLHAAPLGMVARRARGGPRGEV